ncbi:MAG: rhodanese-like domain-containing protein [Candidatus Eisenbacteria bacterium]
MKPAFKKYWLLLLVLGPVWGMVGCSDDDKTTTPTATDEFSLAAAAGDAYFSSYTTANGLSVNTTATDVWTNLSDGDATNDPYIIDWRSAAHFAAGHIEGAHNAALANFSDVVSTIPAGKTVVNVCYTGQSASHATAFMNLMGIPAQNLKFGMCGWTADTAVNLGKWDDAVSDDYTNWLTTTASTATVAHTFPTISTGKDTAPEIIRERAQTYLAAGWKTISIAALYQAIEVDGLAGDYFIMNYFPSGEYDAGHVPGAVRFEPKASLGVDQMLKYLPTDKKIVVYCYTGQTSSQVVAYLNALGYDAYSLLYGVNGMCHSNAAVCTAPYHQASTNYPVVTN